MPRRRRENPAHRKVRNLMDYDVLFRKQRGKCAICKERWTELTHAGKKRRRMHRDHDRVRMIPRGLLCGPCNRQLRDRSGGKVFDADWYSSAGRYLRRYEKEIESGR